MRIPFHGGTKARETDDPRRREAAGAESSEVYAVCVEPSHLAGLWRRTLLVDEDGRQDVTTDVVWLQGPGLYVDLRHPAGRPSFDSVRRLRDLSYEQVRWMATQQAFAGRLSHRGEYVEWTRSIDLHPPGPTPDAGTLSRERGLLVERGRHTDYVEHWQAEPGDSEPVWARELVDEATGVRAVVLRVGSWFGWARGRSSMRVDPASSLEVAQDLVDVEVSLGTVAGNTWMVVASTLPFRERAVLDVIVAGDTVTTQRRRWVVTHAEGEIAP